MKRFIAYGSNSIWLFLMKCLRKGIGNHTWVMGSHSHVMWGKRKTFSKLNIYLGKSAKYHPWRLIHNYSQVLML